VTSTGLETPAVRAARSPARRLPPLATAVLLLGVAESMVMSYLVLFAADEVGMTPLQLGVFLTAPAAGGLVVSWLLGRLFDRRPARSYAVAVTALAAAGLGLMTLTTSFPLLVLLAVTLLGGQTAAFPQLFALARLLLGDGAAGERSAPLLRSVWSLAWGVGPLIGAVVLSRGGFTAVLWGGAAVLVATSLVTALAVPTPDRVLVAGARPTASAQGASEPTEAVPTAPRVALATCGVTLFFTAMFAGSVALPLFVTRDLQENATAVGVLFSVCAFVEVAAALVLVVLPARVSQRAVVMTGMLAFVLYFALTVAAGGMTLLVAAQVARGLAIGWVGAAGIRFFQDLLAPATGRATTLFANASTTGSLVSGLLAGASVSAFGPRTTLLLCGAFATAATASFLAGTTTRRPLRNG
jgi:SET family sugar efflux transporter-like MFS transporter